MEIDWTGLELPPGARIRTFEEIAADETQPEAIREAMYLLIMTKEYYKEFPEKSDQPFNESDFYAWLKRKQN